MRHAGHYVSWGASNFTSFRRTAQTTIASSVSGRTFMPTFLATTATKALRTYALLWLLIWMSRLLGAPSQDNDQVN